jgi:hypothetical protein
MHTLLHNYKPLSSLQLSLISKGVKCVLTIHNNVTDQRKNDPVPATYLIRRLMQVKNPESCQIFTFSTP